MIYLDNNATTALDPLVDEAMHHELLWYPHNASSVTYYGRKAKAMLLRAKQQIASQLNLAPDGIFFTSGATEANNWLVQSFFATQKKPIIVTSPLEHPSILLPIRHLQKSQRIKIIELPLDERGSPSVTALADILSTSAQEITCIFLSLANNETGVILDHKACAALALQYSVPLVLDGVQALGKMDILLSPGITAITFSAHKCHGPKGVGFIYVDKPFSLQPLLRGGAQECGLRAGTENLTGIVGCAKAVELMLLQDQIALRKLRDHLERGLYAVCPDIKINGKEERIVNTANIHFPHIDGEVFLIQLEQMGIIVSLGSACAAGALAPSSVLMHMGLTAKEASQSIRFSLSRMNTLEEIDRTIEKIGQLQKNLCA